MEKITIYYDDTKQSCCTYANKLADDSQFIFKKASEYKDKNLVYEENTQVGFLFEAVKADIPYDMNHIIWRIEMKEDANCFIAVCGGSQELRVLRKSMYDLNSRGYQVGNVYSHYIVERFHIEKDNMIEIIRENVNQNINHVSSFALLKSQSSKSELRKIMRKELRKYRQYNRESLNKMLRDK